MWKYYICFHIKVHACPVGDVDVEKPKHMSRPITVHMYSLVNSSRLSITLPIHLRYHRAKSKGGSVYYNNATKSTKKLHLNSILYFSYETVRIIYPWILLRCPNNVFKLCESTDTIVAPCAACSPHKCSWHNITTKAVSFVIMYETPVSHHMCICSLMTAFNFYIIAVDEFFGDGSSRGRFERFYKCCSSHVFCVLYWMFLHHICVE